MGTIFFADRGHLFANGKEMANVKTIKLTIDESVSVVSTMTSNKRDVGYKQGNRKVTGSFEIEIPDGSPAPDLSFLYGQDVSLISQTGTAGDRYLLKGVVANNQDISASVGEAGKTINFTALDAVNANGPGVNSQLGF